MLLPRSLLLLFLSSVSLHAAEAWAPGVSRNDGWIDFNKTCKDSSNYMADMGMCWAASASNVITWWQGQNPDAMKSVTLPSADVWDVFRTVYKDVGGTPSAAYDWWINGRKTDEYGVPKDDGLMDFTQETKETAFWYDGGFLKGIYAETAPNATTYLISSYNDAYAFSKQIVDALNSGYALSISAFNSGVAHAYTLWGVEYEVNNGQYELTKVWVTDSDDGETKLVEKLLQCVNKGESGYVAFEEQFGATWQYVAGMSTSVIPEPSAFGLLAGMAALALVGSRRRKRS